jgi:lipoate-protein ligase A
MADSAGKPFRVIDTGLRGGRANIAFDQALIDARKAGKIPDTIRFLRFRPSALIGVHQMLGREIKVDYCRSHGIEIVRRITGGGGLYLDEGQIGWELVFDRATLDSPTLPEAMPTTAAMTIENAESLSIGYRRASSPWA